MDPIIRPVTPADGPAVIGIFNQYAQAPASFFDFELPAQAFAKFQAETQGYPFLVAEAEGKVAGFAFMHAFHPSPLMKRTALITYFLDQAARGKGLGSRLLSALEHGARAMGVANLVAMISSANQESLGFHGARGFVECGRLEQAGVKQGQDFAVVYMQKQLA